LPRLFEVGSRRQAEGAGHPFLGRGHRRAVARKVTAPRPLIEHNSADSARPIASPSAQASPICAQRPLDSLLPGVDTERHLLALPRDSQWLDVMRSTAAL